MTNSILNYGVGIRDEDLPLNTRCLFYDTWMNMLKRCYSSSYQSVQTTYSDCSVCKEWLTFSKFKAWMQTQDWEGKELDKDLLYKGNRVYSPMYCVFISRQLNSFLLKKKHKTIEETGFYFNSRLNKYQAQISNPFLGKKVYLGIFSTPEEAHRAWRSKKHEFACKFADMQTDSRLAEALRNRFKEDTL